MNEPDPMTVNPVSEAQRILDHRFEDSELLKRALTHGSRSGGDGEDYQRLEFLGDAVLELVTREWLMERYPEEPEGDLTRRKIGLVQKGNLAARGRKLGLHRLARVGGGFVSTPAAMDSLAADLVESVIGAIYLDAGLRPARELIIREILKPSPEMQPLADARSRLQEYCQSRGINMPRYSDTGREGPDHAPVFTVTVSVDGREMGQGTGRTIRAAREEAAWKALSIFERMVEK